MTSYKITENRLSLKEIADANAVSLATVYRVINGTGKVHSPRHDRLRMMLGNAGYMNVPAPLAGAILLAVPPTLSSHAIALINFLRAECDRVKIDSVMTLCSNLGVELTRRQAIGVIALAEVDCPPGTPCVYLNLRDGVRRHSAVVQELADNFFGMLCFLRDRGFRRIGFFDDLARSGATHFFLKRGSYDIEQLFDYAGMPYDPALVWREQISTSNHFEVCRHAAEFFVSQPRLPEVILSQGDVSMVTIARFLRERGVTAPRDLRFAACDDSLCWPLPDRSYIAASEIDAWHNILAEADMPIFVNRSPLEAMARMVLDLLQERIRNPEAVIRQILLQHPVEEVQYTPLSGGL